MTQNDIIDIDKYIAESGLLVDDREAVADLPYSGKRPLDSLKNYLVTEWGFDPNTIDFFVGAPGGFRERFYSPGRGYDPLGVPPFTPLQFRGFRELLEPTDYATRKAREAGIKEDPPFSISRTAAFLPQDSYDTGVQKLIKKYYKENFDVPLSTNYEFQREPYGKQVIYRDPIDKELKFINPPGVDLANFTAGLEPAGLELISGIVGFKVAGISGAFVAPIATQFLWRYNNLRNLEEEGLLDESYDNSKILTTAMKDAGITALFQVGGATVFKALKILGGGKMIPGIPEDEFVTAYEALKASSEESGLGKNILETATVPEILEAGKVGSPIVRRGLEAELVDRAAKGDKRAAVVAARLEEGAKAKREEFLESTVEEAGESIPTKGAVSEELTKLGEDVVLRKEELGAAIIREFDETLDPKIAAEVRKIEEVRGNFDTQLKALTDESVEPEVALNNLRETLKDLAKGDKALPNTSKGFKLRLNKIVSDNKTEDKILDNVFELFRTSDRKFFQGYINDPELVDSKIILRNAFKNKYKNMLQTDEAGRLMPMSREAHQKFVNDNKNLIEDLFDVEDATAFKNAENFARRLDSAQKSFDRATRELQRQPWGGNGKPEYIFKNTWTREREGITTTRKVFDIIGENQELADEYRLLILNDMKQQTNNFTTGVGKYLDDYGAMLDVWYPKNVTKNLKFLSELIDDMAVNPGAKGGDDLSVEVLNKMFRIYFGFFTPTGRALSATKQLLSVFKNKRFVDTLLEPEKYLKGIQARKLFFNNPYVLEFVRGTTRTAARESELTSGFVEPEAGQIEQTDPLDFFVPEKTEMNRGGEALMELKY